MKKKYSIVVLGLISIVSSCSVLKPNTSNTIEQSIVQNKNTLYGIYKFKNRTESMSDSIKLFQANTDYKINNHYINIDALKKIASNQLQMNEEILDISTLKKLQDIIQVISDAKNLIEDLNYYTVLFIQNNETIASMSLENKDKQWKPSEYMNTRMIKDGTQLIQLSNFIVSPAEKIQIDCFTASGTAHRFYRIKKGTTNQYYTSLLSENGYIAFISFDNLIKGLLLLE